MKKVTSSERIATVSGKCRKMKTTKMNPISILIQVRYQNELFFSYLCYSLVTNGEYLLPTEFVTDKLF